jgi:histidinol-phosphate/aromatic aminotransferase/cobyric acid decarboxylase-like protein
MRFRDYYKQFDELPPDEVSRELRERRDAERAPARQDALDLSVSGWHEPPHPEVVNAATFALRRAVNAYADPRPLREAIAAAHAVDPARVVVGHGAGELLRAALHALAAGGHVRVAWPGWAPLPRLVREAGGRPLPVRAGDLGATKHSWSDAPAGSRLVPAGGPAARALVLARPADPTGELVPLDALRALAGRLAPDAWLILDEALAGFLPDGEDAILDHPRVIHVRSFSKAHAMAGFRVGYAIVPDERLVDPLTPVLGVGAAALAGALWAVESGAPVARRRRDQIQRERERLAEGLHGGPVSFPAGHGPYVWLASSEHDGRALAERLGSRRIFVAPGAAWDDDRHVRATLRDAATTDRLAAALR